MAGNPYANGGLSLGDNKYVTDGPKQGYIYVCNVPQNGGGGAAQGSEQNTQMGQMQVRPPQEAYTVCSGKTIGTSCSVTGPRGTVSGTCQNPSGQSELCVPTMPEQNSGTPHQINY